VFRAGAHAATAEEAQRFADKPTLVGAAERITCPLLVVVVGADKLVPPSEGERLAKTASGPTELVVYPKAIMSASTSATNTVRSRGTGWPNASAQGRFPTGSPDADPLLTFSSICRADLDNVPSSREKKECLT
jgi:fermentation-respiration switch protein FrsA (DUF1100 family)